MHGVKFRHCGPIHLKVLNAGSQVITWPKPHSLAVAKYPNKSHLRDMVFIQAHSFRGQSIQAWTWSSCSHCIHSPEVGSDWSMHAATRLPSPLTYSRTPARGMVPPTAGSSSHLSAIKIIPPHMLRTPPSSGNSRFCHAEPCPTPFQQVLLVNTLSV